MRTWEAINGFIAGEPKLSFTEDGKARLYVRVGINHFERLEGGSYRKLAPTYHDLIQFGKGAELSHERFRKGDDFVAMGYVRDYTRQVDGQERKDEQFVASRIAHDPNTTTYEIQRRPRAADRDSTERTAPDTDRDTAATSSPATTPDLPPPQPRPVPPPPPTSEPSSEAMTR